MDKATLIPLSNSPPGLPSVGSTILQIASHIECTYTPLCSSPLTMINPLSNPNHNAHGENIEHFHFSYSYHFFQLLGFLGS